MKRKIIVVCLVLCMLFTMSAVCFAAEGEEYPTYIFPDELDLTDFYANYRTTQVAEFESNGTLYNTISLGKIGTSISLTYSYVNKYGGYEYQHRVFTLPNASYPTLKGWEDENYKTIKIVGTEPDNDNARLWTAFYKSNATLVSKEWWDLMLSAYGLNVQLVLSVAVFAVGCGAGFAFMWWGVRKGSRMLFSAFKKGRFQL